MNKQEIKEYANKGRERLGSRKWIILLFLFSFDLYKAKRYNKTNRNSHRIPQKIDKLEEQWRETG